MQMYLSRFQETRVIPMNRSDVLETETASPSSTCVTEHRTALMVMTKILDFAQPVGRFL
jgi:hypothetical protein